MKGQIKALIACGIEPSKVAQIFDLTQSQLYSRYAKEIATAEAEANVAVAQSLFKMATSGKHPQASIFWMKARAGWDDKSDLIEDSLNHKTPREEIIKRIQELEQSAEVKH